MRPNDKLLFSNGQRDYARFKWFFSGNGKNTLNADVPEKFTFLSWTVYPPSTCISHMRKDSKSNSTYLLKAQVFDKRESAVSVAGRVIIGTQLICLKLLIPKQKLLELISMFIFLFIYLFFFLLHIVYSDSSSGTGFETAIHVSHE